MKAMPGFFGLVALVFLELVGAAAAGAEGLAVEGGDRARILPPAGAVVTDYENAGYRLTWSAGEARVEVEASPLRSVAAYRPPRWSRRLEADPVARLARGLTSDADTYYEAVSRILGWMSRNVEYRLDRAALQDARAVLERRNAYCTGVARLAVALLRSAGIEAREVAGYVAGDGYHRWIEARLPDRGWVFSDPLTSHHYVPATYVRLASDELWEERGLDGLLLERDARLATVDLYPPAGRGVTARRNQPRQLAAALRLEIDGAGAGQAWLLGERERHHGLLHDGRLTFVGLEPGRYRLLLELAGAGVFDRQIDLPDRVPAALRLAIERGADRLPLFPSNRRGNTSR